MIFTTGLNGQSPSALAADIDDLASAAPLLVLDTRSSRYSYHPEFRNDFVASNSTTAGYRWDPRLGGHPDVPALYNEDGRIRYPDLIAQPFFRDGVDQLVADHQASGGNVLVVCACENHATCHRTRAIGRALTERGVDVAELRGATTRDTLAGFGPGEGDVSAVPIPQRQRHAVPNRLDPGRPATPPARPPAAQVASAAAPASNWRERLAAAYRATPTRDTADRAMILSTLATPEAVAAIAQRPPSLIIDFREGAPSLRVADATVLRPTMTPATQQALLRELANLQERDRPVAIIINDPESLGLAAVIRNGAALLAGLEVDLRIVDDAGVSRSYTDALALVRPKRATPEVPSQSPPEATSGATTTNNNGFVLIKGLLSEAQLGQIAGDVEHAIDTAPLYRPRMKSGTAFRYDMTCAGGVGWISDENGYRYDETHPSGKPWAQMPRSIDDTVRLALATAGLDASYQSQTCLINQYGADSRLGAHVDRDEQCEQPVVSISLGASCDFEVNGKTYTLEHGDVCILSGASRFAKHGVTKIHGNKRTNLTIRQVYPRTIEMEMTGEHLSSASREVDSRRPDMGEQERFTDRQLQQPDPADRAERTDDFAELIQRAHADPPRDPRFATFSAYEHAGAAVIRTRFDPLGLLVPDNQTKLTIPTERGAVEAPSALHAVHALLMESKETQRRTLWNTRSIPAITTLPRSARAVELLDYALRLNLSQSKDAREILLSTGELPIVAASAADAWWGAVNAGDRYQGYNVEGKLYEAIRSDLQRDPHALDNLRPPQGLRLIDSPVVISKPKEIERTEPVQALRTKPREVKVYAGIGQSDRDEAVPDDVKQSLRKIGHRLAAQGYQLRSGGATGCDTAFHLGVVDYLVERYGSDWHRQPLATQHAARLTDIWTPGETHERAVKEAHLPSTTFHETDPRTTWAVKEALRIHPNPRALQRSEFALRAHARNMVQALGEDGKHPVEFVVCWAPQDQTGLPTGGTRTAVALAKEREIPTFNLIDPTQAHAAEAYLVGIEHGTLRFGDGKDALGGLYIAPRSSNLAGMPLQYFDPRTTPLANANIAQANMAGVAYDNLDLTRAYARGLNADNATLDGVARYFNGTEANFTTAELRGTWTAAIFERATLTKATLEGTFDNAIFRHADLAGATISGSVRHADFRSANLTGARIEVEALEALRGTRFEGAIIEGLQLPPELEKRLEELQVTMTPEQRHELFARQPQELTRE